MEVNGDQKLRTGSPVMSFIPISKYLNDRSDLEEVLPHISPFVKKNGRSPFQKAVRGSFNPAG